MGPESAKSVAGHALVHAAPADGHPTQRARQEHDYGRRGTGYVFGAFRPATGEALTRCCARRTTANWVDFLAVSDGWVPDTVERSYAIRENLSAHRASDVLLFSLWRQRRRNRPRREPGIPLAPAA